MFDVSRGAVPFGLFGESLLLGLRLHLLHLDGVGLAAPHVQLVVAHAERQDALVDAQPRCIEDKVLQAGNNNTASTHVIMISLHTVK